MNTKRKTLQDKLAKLGLGGVGQGSVTPDQQLEQRERERREWGAVRAAVERLGVGGVSLATVERLRREIGDAARQAAADWRADAVRQIDAAERRQAAQQAAARRQAAQAKRQAARQAAQQAAGGERDYLHAEWLAWLASRQAELSSRPAAGPGWRDDLGQRILDLADWAAWRVRRATEARGGQLGDVAFDAAHGAAVYGLTRLAQSTWGMSAILGGPVPSYGRWRKPRGKGRKPSALRLSAPFVASALARRGVASAAPVSVVPDWTSDAGGPDRPSWADRCGTLAAGLVRQGVEMGGQAGRAVQRAGRLASMLADGERLTDATCRAAGYASVKSALSSLVQRGLAAGWLVAPDLPQGGDAERWLPYVQPAARVSLADWQARQARQAERWLGRALHERPPGGPQAARRRPAVVRIGPGMLAAIKGRQRPAGGPVVASLAGAISDAARRQAAARQAATLARYDAALRRLRAGQLLARRLAARGDAARLAVGRSDAARAVYAVRGWPSRMAR